MKYKYSFLLILFIANIISNQDNCIQIKKEELKSNLPKIKIKVLLGIVDNNSNKLTIETLSNCLIKSEQFDIDIKYLNPIKNIKDLTDLYNSGYILAAFLSSPIDSNAIEWRLYDLLDKKMVIGKKIHFKSLNPKWNGFSLADSLLPYLINQEGSFASQISYVKKVKTNNKNATNIVCCSNVDGSDEKILIKNPGIYVGTYWHPNNKEPRVFTSEFTKSNVRIISTDFNDNKQAVINMPGTCVGVSLSKNNEAVYCRSGSIWHYTYNKDKRTGTHTQIIKNDGKCLSPILLESGDIIFCSDSKVLSKCNRKIPQIYKYIKSDGNIQKLTEDGYILCPTYNEKTHKIAYSKRVNKKLQLFCLDLNTKKEIQLTFDDGNKIDPYWSNCGNYLVYCEQKDRKSRIAVIYPKFLTRSYITDINDYCTSPSWSPIYNTLENSPKLLDEQTVN